MTKNKSLTIVLICYIIALIISLIFINTYGNSNLIIKLLYADIIATIVIYGASYIFKNSSIYDPYWSVVPPILLLFWFTKLDTINVTNAILLSLSVLFWGIRLTYNWIRNWNGLNHEDWRYIDFRKKFKNNYQLVNFLGIHLFPSLIVFACCIPFKYILDNEKTDLGVIIGFIICFIGVMYEIVADQQLYNFKKKNPGKIIKIGLWKYSRHPNYYGEILFWWGLFIYSYSVLHLIIWPICMTLMFIFVSIPWIEKKILKTRPEYKKYQEEVNILFTEVTIIKKLFKN